MQGVTLKCLGSSSSGNCYIIETGNEALILECGLPILQVKKSLNWNLSKVVGCLISHKHQDHSKYLPEVLKCGIKVLALDEVFNRQQNRLFCKTIKPMHGYKVGSFKVLAFDLQHANSDRSPCPCLGFLIENNAMGKLLFMTDTMMLKYHFPEINHIMIEANYDDDILDYNVQQGNTTSSEKPRLLASHLEIKQATKIIKRLNNPELQNIVLLHLSSRNSDEKQFKGLVQEATGKPVAVARPGLEINLSKEPY